MVELSSDRFFRAVFHEHVRRLLAVVVGIWVACVLTGHSWPWWAWLPAAILATGAVYALLLLAVYSYHKATYQRRAEMIRQQLRETNNEDQASHSSLTN